MLEELRSSTLLSNWGGVTGLSGEVEERCFLPGKDVAVPGALKESTVRRAPWLLGEDALRRQLAARETQAASGDGVSECWHGGTVAWWQHVHVHVPMP